MLRSFEFKPLTLAGGRFVRWRPYTRGMRYSFGLDCALGIPGKDYDAGVLLDVERRQVATLHGHWSMGFADRIKTVVDAYGGPTCVFIVGEAASIGLAVLRDLWDSGYSWMYRHRADERPGRDVRDILGHVPGKMDVTVTWLQEAVASGSIEVCDEVLHAELCKFGFRPRSRTMTDEDATRSEHLTWSAPPGEHDDLVRALALANAGIEWLPQFKAPPVELPAKSIGKRLGFDREDDSDKPKRYWRQ